MQRGRAFPSQHHTLGWNARRDFFSRDLKPRIHTDEHGLKKQNKKGIALKDVDVDSSKNAGLDLFRIFPYPCSSV
jgi:hypothetical protein